MFNILSISLMFIKNPLLIKTGLFIKYIYMDIPKYQIKYINITNSKTRFKTYSSYIQIAFMRMLQNIRLICFKSTSKNDMYRNKTLYSSSLKEKKRELKHFPLFPKTDITHISNNYCFICICYYN